MLRDHLEKLHHFVGCVRSGSIRRYANSHRYSQSAISKSIQILEVDLEVSLLHRSREGLRLTRAGEELLAFAEKFLRDADLVDSEIRSESNLKLHGSFTMGTYPSIAVYFVPEFFLFIQQKQSSLSMNVSTAPSGELVEMLINGMVDFTVSIDPPKKHALFRDVLLKDTYSLYAPIGFKNSLAESVLFTMPEACDLRGKTILSYLEDHKLSHRLSSCSDFESVKAMVTRGIGYGLLPDRVAQQGILDGKITLAKEFPKLRHFGEHEIVFCCKKTRSHEKSIHWLHSQLKAMLSSWSG